MYRYPGKWRSNLFKKSLTLGQPNRSSIMKRYSTTKFYALADTVSACDSSAEFIGMGLDLL